MSSSAMYYGIPLLIGSVGSYFVGVMFEEELTDKSPEIQESTPVPESTIPTTTPSPWDITGPEPTAPVSSQVSPFAPDSSQISTFAPISSQVSPFAPVSSQVTPNAPVSQQISQTPQSSLTVSPNIQFQMPSYQPQPVAQPSLMSSILSPFTGPSTTSATSVTPSTPSVSSVFASTPSATSVPSVFASTPSDTSVPSVFASTPSATSVPSVFASTSSVPSVTPSEVQSTPSDTSVPSVTPSEVQSTPSDTSVTPSEVQSVSLTPSFTPSVPLVTASTPRVTSDGTVSVGPIDLEDRRRNVLYGSVPSRDSAPPSQVDRDTGKFGPINREGCVSSVAVEIPSTPVSSIEPQSALVPEVTAKTEPLAEPSFSPNNREGCVSSIEQSQPVPEEPFTGHKLDPEVAALPRVPDDLQQPITGSSRRRFKTARRSYF